MSGTSSVEAPSNPPLERTRAWASEQRRHERSAPAAQRPGRWAAGRTL